MLRRRASYAALAVALAVSMSSCDSADILQPTDAAPQFSQSNGKGKHTAPGQQKQTLKALEVTQAVSGTSADRVIGRQGGSVAVEATMGGVVYTHTLLVPKNAVRTDTEFEMSVVMDAPHIGVELSATSLGGTYNDVGGRGFTRPVTLCLSVDRALVPPGMDLGIALDDNGDLTPLASWQVDDGQDVIVCAELTHFSRFIIIHN